MKKNKWYKSFIGLCSIILISTISFFGFKANQANDNHKLSQPHLTTNLIQTKNLKQQNLKSNKHVKAYSILSSQSLYSIPITINLNENNATYTYNNLALKFYTANNFNASINTANWLTFFNLWFKNKYNIQANFNNTDLSNLTSNIINNVNTNNTTYNLKNSVLVSFDIDLNSTLSNELRQNDDSIFSGLNANSNNIINFQFTINNFAINLTASEWNNLTNLSNNVLSLNTSSTNSSEIAIWKYFDAFNFNSNNIISNNKVTGYILNMLFNTNLANTTISNNSNYNNVYNLFNFNTYNDVNTNSNALTYTFSQLSISNLTNAVLEYPNGYYINANQTLNFLQNNNQTILNNYLNANTYSLSDSFMLNNLSYQSNISLNNFLNATTLNNNLKYFSANQIIAYTLYHHILPLNYQINFNNLIAYVANTLYPFNLNVSGLNLNVANTNWLNNFNDEINATNAINLTFNVSTNSQRFYFFNTSTVNNTYLSGIVNSTIYQQMQLSNIKVSTLNNQYLGFNNLIIYGLTPTWIPSALNLSTLAHGIYQYYTIKQLAYLNDSVWSELVASAFGQNNNAFIFVNTSYKLSKIQNTWYLNIPVINNLNYSIMVHNQIIKPNVNSVILIPIINYTQVYDLQTLYLILWVLFILITISLISYLYWTKKHAKKQKVQDALITLKQKIDKDVNFQYDLVHDVSHIDTYFSTLTKKEKRQWKKRKKKNDTKEKNNV